MEYEQRLAGPWLAARLDAASSNSHGIPASTAELPWFEASVPGAIQYDLVRAGALQNPFAGTEAAFAAHWVAESDWLYRTTFDAALDRSVRWALEFDGIDTFAEIWLNGEQIGQTANAYRQYRFDLRPGLLQQIGNELVVRVNNHGSGIIHKIDEARNILGHRDGVEGRLGKSLIRRYQRSFFSGNSTLLNVGTGVLGIGMHRPVRLRAIADVEIVDVFAKTTSLTPDRAVLECSVALNNSANAGAVEVEVTLTGPHPGDRVVASARAAGVDGGTVQLPITVENPELWWPRGYGEPNLYRVLVCVRQDGQLIHSVERDIGIRTVALLEETASGRPTFQIVVNGTPIYVRGTNLIPVDYLKVHGTPQDYVRIFALLENGNNNLVRMWGGGAIESEDFYDECDRRGVMIWQDGYLHSMYYPEYDPDFVAEFRTESREMITKVRRHPCLVMLCGGNEQREGWEEWGWKDELDRFYGETLITQTLPELIEELSPGVPYVDNSPHGGTWARSPLRGDGHIWGNHFNSFKDPLFVSETCWGLESYSRAETLKEVMELDVADYAGKGWVQKWTAQTGRPLINKFPYSGYHNAGGLGPYIHGLELEQALADHHSLANFRLRSSSCHGIVYWSFNKGGPLFQFGSVDYRLRPLMSYYFVSRLFRDIVVGIYRDVDDIRILASNVTGSDVDVSLELLHLDTDGKVLKRWTQQHRLAAGGITRMLDLDDYYSTVVQRDREVLFARLTVAGKVVSDDILLFAPLVEVIGPPPDIDIQLQKTSHDTWTIELATSGVSKLVAIEGTDGLILSDNYFPLVNQMPRSIQVRALEAKGKPIALTVTSLDSEVSAQVSLQ